MTDIRILQGVMQLVRVNVTDVLNIGNDSTRVNTTGINIGVVFGSTV